MDGIDVSGPRVIYGKTPKTLKKFRFRARNLPPVFDTVSATDRIRSDRWYVQTCRFHSESRRRASYTARRGSDYSLAFGNFPFLFFVLIT